MWAEPPEVCDGAAMAVDNRSTSALFKRAEQIRRWQESDTNKQEISDNHRTRKVNFTDGCIFLAACAAGDKQEVIRLLEKGADIDTANVDGLTALHAVSASRHSCSAGSHGHRHPTAQGSLLKRENYAQNEWGQGHLVSRWPTLPYSKYK